MAAHDNEGNRTEKYSDASHTTPVKKYFWDHRNRLTKTELYVSGQLDKTVEYAYDHNNRMYSRIVDAASDSRQIFVRSGDQIVLELADDNVGEVASSDLTRRALWRPDTVDQLIAEEHIGNDTFWMLPDHLGTVRDIVSYDSATDTTTLEEHNEFTSFGVLLNTPTVTPLALYTGRFYDPLTQKQYNRERWYDLSTGRWMSVDPIGFKAGDVNLYRYVGNSSTSWADPLGLLTAQECEELKIKAMAYLSAWHDRTQALITDNYDNSRDALDKLYGFWSDGLATLSSLVTAGTNLSWAGGAFGSSATGGTVGVASVLVQIVANAAIDSAINASAGALYNEVLKQMKQVRQQDRDKATEVFKAETDKLAKVATVSGNDCKDCCGALEAYYNGLQSRLPIVKKPTPTDDIYGRLLLSVANANGWKITGSAQHLKNHGKYWYIDTTAGGIFSGTDWPFVVDASDIADELNELGYKNGHAHAF